MNLLLDLGNTRVKWAIDAGQGALGPVAALDWRDAMADVLASAWRDLSRPTRVLAASVADPGREQAVGGAVLARFGLAVQWVRTPAAAGGVRNAYAEPQRLGVDRFLAMLAAHADGRSPCLLAGCGTALTLDALAADGTHLGGLIAPGAPLMQRAVLGATAQVHVLEPGRVLERATNTPDALVSGCWQAAAALVDRFHQRHRALLGGAPRLLLHGGDAPQLAPLLESASETWPDAVLRGLAHWRVDSAD